MAFLHFVLFRNIQKSPDSQISIFDLNLSSRLGSSTGISGRLGYLLGLPSQHIQTSFHNMLYLQLFFLDESKYSGQ